MPQECLKQGSFCITRGKAYVDFLVKAGCTAEEAKKAEGSHWKCCVTKTCEKNWRVIICCKECPEMNAVVEYVEGEEACIDMPIYGGPAKITLTNVDESTMKVCSKSEKFGQLESTMVYTDQGLTLTLKSHKNGATLSENWCRWVDEEGSYRYICNENGAEYCKGIGMTEDFDKMIKGAGFRLTKIGSDDCWQFDERFGGRCHSMKVKFDEECDYDVPGWERKMLITRLAPGKVKCIMRNPKDGRVEEWIRWITPSGKAIWCGEDKKTGNKCKMVYEKFSCPSGTWRPISITGGEAVARACGMPAQLAKDMANDYDHKICVKEVGEYFHMSNNSKYTPINLIYKLDEEYEFSFPGCDEKIKAIETACGNTYTLIERTSKWCVKNVTKVTNNFMIINTRVMGTNACAKYIYTRCAKP